MMVLRCPCGLQHQERPKGRHRNMGGPGWRLSRNRCMEGAQLSQPQWQGGYRDAPAGLRRPMGRCCCNTRTGASVQTPLTSAPSDRLATSSHPVLLSYWLPSTSHLLRRPGLRRPGRVTAVPDCPTSRKGGQVGCCWGQGEPLQPAKSYISGHQH